MHIVSRNHCVNRMDDDPSQRARVGPSALPALLKLPHLAKEPIGSNKYVYSNTTGKWEADQHYPQWDVFKPHETTLGTVIFTSFATNGANNKVAERLGQPSLVTYMDTHEAKDPDSWGDDPVSQEVIPVTNPRHYSVPMAPSATIGAEFTWQFETLEMHMPWLRTEMPSIVETHQATTWPPSYPRQLSYGGTTPEKNRTISNYILDFPDNPVLGLQALTLRCDAFFVEDGYTWEGVCAGSLFTHYWERFGKVTTNVAFLAICLQDLNDPDGIRVIGRTFLGPKQDGEAWSDHDVSDEMMKLAQQCPRFPIKEHADPVQFGPGSRAMRDAAEEWPAHLEALSDQRYQSEKRRRVEPHPSDLGEHDAPNYRPLDPPGEHDAPNYRPLDPPPPALSTWTWKSFRETQRPP